MMRQWSGVVRSMGLQLIAVVATWFMAMVPLGAQAAEPASFTHNGRPFFPITLYGFYPYKKGAPGALDKISSARDRTRSHLQDLADAGFNVFHYAPYSLQPDARFQKTVQETKEWIEECGRHGLNVEISLIRFGGWLKKVRNQCVYDSQGNPEAEYLWPTLQKELGILIDAIKDYENLHDYWFADEPEYGAAKRGRNLPLAMYNSMRRVVKQHDSKHPLWLNQVDIIQLAGCGFDCTFDLMDHTDTTYPVTRVPLPRVSTPYDYWKNIVEMYPYYRNWTPPGDVFSMDIYPVGAAWHPTAWALDCTRMGFEVQRDHILATRGNPPQAIYLQAWPIRGVAPTYGESRYMAFDVITAGAKGICYYGSSFLDPQGDSWKGITKVTKELSYLKDVLAAGVTIDPSQYTVPRMEPDAKRPRGLNHICKQYPATGHGKRYLILTHPRNRLAAEVDPKDPNVHNNVELVVPGWTGPIEELLSSDQGTSWSVVGRGSRMVADFVPWGVHVYRADWTPPTSTTSPASNASVPGNGIAPRPRH